MLSRVADSLYWMSRYLERAEHTVRMLDVNMGYAGQVQHQRGGAMEAGAGCAGKPAGGRAGTNDYYRWSTR